MHKTQHAKIREQQRGISQLAVDLLLKFGVNEPAGGGAKKYYLDKGSRRRVKNYAGPLAGLLDEHLDIYAVAGKDDTIITTGHRTKRVRHV
ncbi:MAG: hypothetical protein CML16_17265 [Pusillimonas sp.]|nr:hypothetical protein [Pusillimonas sp.]MBC44121.1 hypothetical protein [Pusillimonas sp.]HCP77525.1 hypothetical protein [Pusillimonas sp.]|tara:strand:+ start:548 stop:820 length:273 start_codon:yes stop_codon:yes gene_type:complete